MEVHGEKQARCDRECDGDWKAPKGDKQGSNQFFSEIMGYSPVDRQWTNGMVIASSRDLANQACIKITYTTYHYSTITKILSP